MAKGSKKANGTQGEKLKYVPMRKAARAMSLVAGIISLCIVLFSAAEAAWSWAAIFVALTGVAFYLVYAMTVDLREAH